MDLTKLTRTFRTLDYAVGVASLGYGIYTAQPFFIGGGIAGLVLAHLNLSDRISTRLRRYFGRKSAAVSARPSQLNLPADDKTLSAPPLPVDYGSNRLRAGASLYSQSRHSRFKSEKHLNHTA